MLLVSALLFVLMVIAWMVLPGGAGTGMLD